MTIKPDYAVLSRALLEGEEKDVIDLIMESSVEPQETDPLSYLMKFEEYVDDAGIYAFEGWGDAVVMCEPEVGRFWVKYRLLLPKEVDMAGAKQLPGRDGVATIELTDHQSGGKVATISFLRRALDELERRNRREAAEEGDSVADADMAQSEMPQSPPGVA
jgi:hypothetical protein